MLLLAKRNGRNWLLMNWTIGIESSTWVYVFVIVSRKYRQEHFKVYYTNLVQVFFLNPMVYLYMDIVFYSSGCCILQWWRLLLILKAWHVNFYLFINKIVLKCWKQVQAIIKFLNLRFGSRFFSLTTIYE